MKGDVGMWLVQIMKMEGNKTTTTTNTSYSIPTSFVGTAHVKDVGMEYDVFVVVVVLFPSCHIPFISKKCFFLLVPPIVLCTWVWRFMHARNTVRLVKLALLEGKTPATRPTILMHIEEAPRRRRWS